MIGLIVDFINIKHLGQDDWKEFYDFYTLINYGIIHKY